MLPPNASPPSRTAPPAVPRGVAFQPASPLVPFGEEFDRTSTAIAIRCVAAGEIYKLTGCLPAWAHGSARSHGHRDNDC